MNLMHVYGCNTCEFVLYGPMLMRCHALIQALIQAHIAAWHMEPWW